MTTFKEMMDTREAGKERGFPTGFSSKGQLLIRDEQGSFHKSSFQKIFAFNSPRYHPYKNHTPEEKQEIIEWRERQRPTGRHAADKDLKDLSPMHVALVNAKRAQPTAKEDMTWADKKLRALGSTAWHREPGEVYYGADEFGNSLSYPATESDTIKHMQDEMNKGREQPVIIGGVTKDPKDDWHDIKPRTEMAQHVINEWGLTPEGGKLDEPKSETRRKEDEAREEAYQEWVEQHWEPDWSRNYSEPDDDYGDDNEESDDDED